MNESKLNVRMLHLMESGFFGKQLLNEGALSLSEGMKVMIFQSIHNYFNENNRITVDGIAGDQTAKTLNGKKELGYDFDKDLSGELKSYYKTQLNKAKKFLSDFKSSNDIHNVRMLQVILCLAGRTEVKPDGIIGPITKEAMSNKLGADNTAQVKDDALTKTIDEAISNVEATSNMGFSVKGIKTSSGNTNTSSGKTSTSSEKTNTSSGKSGSSGAYDAIFVAGITSGVGINGQIEYFKNGFGKDKNVAAFFLNGTPYGHKQTIAQVLADNPKIPAFLFSAGAGQVSNIASNGNANVNKIFVIEPYFGKGQTVQSKIKAAIGNGVPTNHIYVGSYPDVGLGVVADATPTSSLNSQSHVDSVTVVARKHSMV